MRLADLGNTASAARLAMHLARWLPASAVHAIAEGAARLAARNPRSPLTTAIRSNQAVARGIAYDSPQAERSVIEVLRHGMHAHGDVFRAMAIGQKALLAGMLLDVSLSSLLDEALGSGRGVVMVGTHMSAFEFLLLTVADRGYPGLALADPSPTGSYRVQNEIRREHGLDVQPIDRQALRNAIVALQQGKLVMTGVDRPTAGGRPLRLFGRTALLPVGHARLALRTGALLVAGVCLSDSPHHYRGVGLGQLDPRDFDGREDSVTVLSQAVLDLFEPELRARPHEWLMYFPLWPELIPA
jgi:KDO2-lipid IV(A) lauroyltransferase